MSIKRLRIFAGPNGSGKSTIYKTLITKGDVNFGIFVNADEIEFTLKSSGKLNFSNYSLPFDFNHFCDSFQKSSFFEKSNGIDVINNLTVSFDCLIINDVRLVNSYFTAFIADYIRTAMLDCIDVFTLETVMSHPSKLEYIKLAKSKGYRVYLYFVSTRDVQINISRVDYRVKTGGHNVSEDKIRSRYLHSLENLRDAIYISDRAYIFDNSNLDNPVWYVEYDGEQIYVKDSSVPSWIDDYLIKKLY